MFNWVKRIDENILYVVLGTILLVFSIFVIIVLLTWGKNIGIW